MSYLAEIALADCGGDRSSLKSSAARTRQCGLEQFFHFLIAAVSRHLQEIAEGETGAMLNQVSGHFQPVFAHRKRQRGAVFVMRSGQAGIFFQQTA